MKKIYLVNLRWVDTITDTTMIDTTLGTAGDWVRWNAWSWFIHTDRTTTDIRHLVMTRLKPNDSVLVIEIIPTGADGWAPQWVWDWFNQRSSQAS